MVFAESPLPLPSGSRFISRKMCYNKEIIYETQISVLFALSLEVIVTHESRMDPWLIRGEEPPDEEMVLSSNSFQLQNKMMKIFSSWFDYSVVVIPEVTPARRKELTCFFLMMSQPPAHRSASLWCWWRRELCCLRRNHSFTSESQKRPRTKQTFFYARTCRYRSHQQWVQLHQRTERGLAVTAASSAQPAGRIPELQAVVWASLQEDEGVWQQQRLDFWRRWDKEAWNKHGNHCTQSTYWIKYWPICLSLLTLHVRGPSWIILFVVRSKLWERRRKLNCDSDSEI